MVWKDFTEDQQLEKEQVGSGKIKIKLRESINLTLRDPYLTTLILDQRFGKILHEIDYAKNGNMCTG